MKNLFLLSILAIFVLLYGCGKQDNQTSQDKNGNTTEQTVKEESKQTDIQHMDVQHTDIQHTDVQHTENKQSNTKEKSNMNNSGDNKTVEIKTKGMSCSHCENSIKAEINKLPDIKEVIADANTNTVKVTYAPGKTDVKAIENAIDVAGYEVVEVKQ
jgi:copper chaperone